MNLFHSVLASFKPTDYVTLDEIYETAMMQCLYSILHAKTRKKGDVTFVGVLCRYPIDVLVSFSDDQVWRPEHTAEDP